ncbi:AAA family ATPase [Microcella sp.]|uniref:AAA family ATPase n=1 Tax=Microcella sp. TaxID=1913979 RepID=UPI002560E1CE|nr:AAA family ATPase [Microcella sp.]MBX9472976.1 AAA family ATPase [Microcella sp.]
MLKKIVRVEDFRAMKAWSSGVEFVTVNLIYGLNGSGKSTFASLFDHVVQNPTEIGNVRVEILDAADSPRTLSAVDDFFWPNVRVFNRAYVARNIRFDESSGPDASALLTLGERQIEAEARQEAIQSRLDAISTEQDVAGRQRDQAQTSQNQLATRTASQIAQELQLVGGRYAARSYRAPEVKALLVDRAALASGQSSDVEEDLKTVTASPMSEVPLEPSTIVDLSALSNRLEQLRARTVTSAPIPELANNPQAERWVQSGLPLHEHATTCYFCMNELTAGRRADLDRHFDASLIALQADLAAFRSEISAAVQSARTSIAELPATNLLFESFRADYGRAREAADEALELYVAYAAALESLATEKSERLFSALPVGALPPYESPDLAAAEKLVDEHNNRVGSLETMRSEAAQRIEHSRIVSITEEYDGYQTTIETNGAILAALTEERATLLEERDALPTTELDPRPLAESLNSDLAYLLGRDELRFAVNGDHYEIQRGGEPARHLSEGERTAISLLYFLCSLNGHEVEQGRVTVVIDDPISSLDSNVLVGASSHLWGRLVDAPTPRQVFILTHNFDLFRMWSNQFQQRRQPWRRTRPAALFEMRIRAVTMGGVARRLPVITEWPADSAIQKRIRSEYHYLFWRLAHTLEDCRNNPSIESDLDAAAILPNIARRVLEDFFAFKYPDLIDNFEGSVTRANENADPTTQRRILRFLHQYSHNGEADTSRGVPRPEAVTVLTAVFDLMKVIDSDHLSSMCAALDVNEASLTSSAESAT